MWPFTQGPHISARSRSIGCNPYFEKVIKTIRSTLHSVPINSRIKKYVIGDTIWYTITLPVPYSVRHVNVHVTSDPPLLVDTGTSDEMSLEALLSSLNMIGIKPKYLFLTHAHPEHCGSASILEKIYNLEVISSFKTAMILDDYARGKPDYSKIVNYFIKQGVPEEELEFIMQDFFWWTREKCFPRHIVKLMPEESWRCFTILDAPGHCLGASCLYEPKNKILLAGDQIIDGITPHVGYEDDLDSQENPLRDYLDFIEKVKELSPGHIFSGHLNLISNVDRVIFGIIERHKIRCDKIMSILSDGRELSAYEVSRILFPNVLDAINLRLAISEAMGHLQYLFYEGSLQQIIMNGKVYYQNKSARNY